MGGKTQPYSSDVDCKLCIQAWQCIIYVVYLCAVTLCYACVVYPFHSYRRDMPRAYNRCI